MKSMLVTGASGFVGGVTAAAAAAAGFAVHGTRLSGSGHWERLDLTRDDATLALVTRLAPDVIVHTAARYGDDGVIVQGSAAVAAAASRTGARLVHVSTDAVFGGDRAPYDESASPAPITPYGRAKAAAEEAVTRLCPDAVIVRISLVIGDGGASPHERLVHDGIPCFEDVLRTPVHVTDLAAALVELAGSGLTGVVHLAGADDMSRLELGRLIAARDGLDPASVCSARAAQPYPLDTRLRSTRWPALRGAREFLKP
ncbi:SDR family oxidoreductase [Nonomuraea sp. NPDC050328]|uniref:SDR family oxidoreductase n=1 Tax=Nonomuraea sp. NPDC050328 TaxID=3364361 RepID=UPI003792622C